MNEAWVETTLGDLLHGSEGSIKTGPFGTALKAAEYSQTGVPLISVGEIGEGFIRVHERTPRVSPDVTDRLAQYLLRTNDIVFARKGSIDRSARVKRHEDGYFLGSDGIRVRLPAGVCPEFIAYQVLTPRVRTWLRQHAGGSTMPSLNQGILERVEISLPPLDEQRRIAGVLGALDDLIETNQRLIASLADMRMAAWSLAKSVQTVKFGSIADLCTDRAAPSDLTGDTTYLALEHFAENGGGLSGKGTAQGLDSQKSRFRAGDVLYGKLRPYFRKVARPDFDGICSTEIWVLRPTPGVTAEFLESVVSSQAFTDFAMQGSGGTHMPRARWDHVSSFPVTVPTAADLARITGLTEAMWRQMWSLHSENETLGRTRDELLPLLLSGRVSVREVAA